MQITALETFIVEPRWLFLAVRTDEGITGWGEPIVEGKAATVAAAIRELSGFLIGKDPSPIEDHWQTLIKGGFYRGGPVLSSAVAGIDQALWDIKGKALGLPIHELLGGPVRQRQRIYGWIGGDEPGQLAESARQRVEQGYDAVKMNGGGKMRALESRAEIKGIVERVAAVRDAVGDAVDIGIDFHGRFSPALARVACHELEPLHPLFVEEPVVPELQLDLAKITEATTIPIATGERLYSRWDFREVLRTGIAVVQPDLSHAGGISEVRRIAAAAETYGVSLAPHCPLGPIAFASCLQVDFASPNAIIQETSLGIHYNAVGSELLDYLVDPGVFEFADSSIARLTGPGLGIEIDEDVVRRKAMDSHNWHNPVWRHADGSFAEW
ncbi:galactonate dehydratase [Microlunatus endophyticus]|uniref:Galactonate dehydratase n=1 Tax=Microlunatus endophyticus TaxID=1716077 RepID=A0A917S400_9ACTN|nr:galactonate dehydratase [Microlunatus endophyticus]GGL55986.1 galactonate dehydratase [Microlunatus endophyticus]